MRAEETITKLERAEELQKNIKEFPLMGLILGVMLACPIVSVHAIYYIVNYANYPSPFLAVPIIIIDLFDITIIGMLLDSRS